ncbi:DUF1707 and DUF2154 domain-containing protein [Streptosporangiaceae bacterium NEAU-GS5]|nr:DUF1707 and DUF2154 domain-containing protein [Streptosporangiaceae bacterium NEAU-GS5]
MTEHEGSGRGDLEVGGRGAMRASHADRDAVMERLRIAAGDGRLTIHELEERIEATHAARTYAELDALIADLPGERSPAAEKARPLVLETRAGTIKQVGAWMVPERITAKVTMGNITIDFTQAVCHHREVLLEATCGTGNITVIVPRGWQVVTENIVTGMGSVRNKATSPAAPDATTLRITGSVGMGDIKIKNPRR